MTIIKQEQWPDKAELIINIYQYDLDYLVLQWSLRIKDHPWDQQKRGFNSELVLTLSSLNKLVDN